MDERSKLHWLTHVCRASDRTLGTIAAAVVLAAHEPADGAEWPAQRALAEAAGLDRRNLRRALEALAAGGFIAVTDGGGPRHAARYRLVMRHEH